MGTGNYLFQGSDDFALDLHHFWFRLPGFQGSCGLLIRLPRRGGGLQGCNEHPQAHRHQGAVGHHHVDQQPQQSRPHVLQVSSEPLYTLATVRAMPKNSPAESRMRVQ